MIFAEEVTKFIIEKIKQKADRIEKTEILKTPWFIMIIIIPKNVNKISTAFTVYPVNKILEVMTADFHDITNIHGQILEEVKDDIEKAKKIIEEIFDQV